MESNAAGTRPSCAADSPGGIADAVAGATTPTNVLDILSRLEFRVTERFSSAQLQDAGVKASLGGVGVLLRTNPDLYKPTVVGRHGQADSNCLALTLRGLGLAWLRVERGLCVGLTRSRAEWVSANSCIHSSMNVPKCTVNANALASIFGVALASCLPPTFYLVLCAHVVTCNGQRNCTYIVSGTGF